MEYALALFLIYIMTATINLKENIVVLIIAGKYYHVSSAKA